MIDKEKNGFMDTYQLELDDLNDIAGGRAITEAEAKELEKIRSKVDEQVNVLLAQGKKREATQLVGRFIDAAERWQRDIQAAGSGSENISISDYFTL